MLRTFNKLFDKRISWREKFELSWRRKWFRILITPMLSVPKNKTYIFIIGCYSSGTTLLSFLLHQHPEVSGYRTEGATLTDELVTPEELGWARMMHPCLSYIYSNLDKINVQRLKKQWGVIHDKSKPIFLEHSTSNWARIEWLRKNFEGAWFIWLKRNGYAVAEGLRRRSRESMRYTAKEYPEGFPIELCAREWVICNTTIDSALQRMVNQITIRYEDLTNKQEATIHRLLQHLPVDDKTLKKITAFEFHGKKLPITNMNHQALTRLDEEDIQAINQVAAPYIHKYGYPVLGK